MRNERNVKEILHLSFVYLTFLLAVVFHIFYVSGFSHLFGEPLLILETAVRPKIFDKTFTEN